jgi:uncharacterized membrane protein (UPF0127 family)
MRHLLLPLLLAASIKSGSTTYPIQLEQAVTQEERVQGLSGRPFLAPDQGMLFHLDEPTYVTIWMYRTQIDLAVAFLDEKGVIREIHELKAYPEIQDPAFFTAQSVTAAFRASYVLEMNAHWFRDHQIKIGNYLIK